MSAVELEQGVGPRRIQAKTREFWLATISLFFISAVATSQLSGVQGILPQIAQGLRVSAGDSQLVLAAAAGGLALGMIPVSLLSERQGRRNIMVLAAVLAAAVGVLTPFCHTLAEFSVLKGTQGFFIAGIAALAMVYVSEEFDSGAVTPAMGMYAAGSMIGTVLGQMLPIWIVAGTGSWRWALGSSAALAITGTAVFITIIPPSRFFTPSVLPYAVEARFFLSHLANSRLLVINLLVFCFVGALICVANALPFRMESPPFNLSPRVYGTLTAVNLAGVLAAWGTGVAMKRIGARRTLLFANGTVLVGAALLVPADLGAVLLGVVLVVIGAYAAHICLTSVTPNIVDKGRAQAASLYMVSFYGGSAVVGVIGSRVFIHAGWNGLVVFVGVLMVLGFVLGLFVRDAGSDSM